MRSLLRVRDFRFLWAGQAISNFGDAVTSLALLITAQRLTGSVAAVAGTAIAIALPQLLFGMAAGVYVDRWNRKTVMVVSDVIRAALVLGFLFVTDAAHIWVMYGVAFAQASVGTFFNPAKGAIVPAVVGREQLLAANSINETTRVVFGLLGTGAAGVFAGLADHLGPVFIADAVTFGASAMIIAAMRVDGRPVQAGTPGPIWADMMTGIRLALSSRLLVGVLVGAAIVMFGLGAVNVLMVPFVIDVLAIPETWFGLLEGAQVSSMVLSGTLVALLAARFRPTSIVVTSLAGAGIVVATISVVTEPWHLILVLFAVGWFVTPLQASAATIIQTEVADQHRGRIGSAFNTMVTSAQVASMALAGVAATTLTVRGTFAAAGAVAVAAAIAAGILFRGVPRPAPAPA